MASAALPLLIHTYTSVDRIADLKPQPAPDPASTELNPQTDPMPVPKPEPSDVVPSNRIRLVSIPIPTAFPYSHLPLNLEAEVNKAEHSSDLQNPKTVPQLLTDRIPAIYKPIKHFYRTPLGPPRPLPRPIFVGGITTLAPIAQFIIPKPDNLPEPTTQEPAPAPEPVEYESEPEQPESEEQDFAILELEQPEPAQLDRTVNLIPENRKNITYYSRPHVPSRPIPRPSLIAQRMEPDSNLQPAPEPTSIPVPKPDPTIQPSIREPPPRHIFKPIPKFAVVKPLPYPRPTEIPTSPIISIKRPKFPVKPDKVKNPLRTQKPRRYWLTTDPSILQDYQCEQPNMYYSVESECDSYIECKLYVPMRNVCPDGLHFNPRVPFPDYPCGYPSDVKCEGRSIKLKTETEISNPRDETTARPFINNNKYNEPHDSPKDLNAQPLLNSRPKSDGGQPAQRVYNRLPIRPNPIPLLLPRPASVDIITDLKPQPAPEPAFTELNPQTDPMPVPKPEPSDVVPSNRIRLVSIPIPRAFPYSHLPPNLEAEVKESKTEHSSDLQNPKTVPQLLTDRIPAIYKPIKHFYRTPLGPPRPIPRPIFVSEITTLAPIAQFITPEPDDLPESTTQEPTPAPEPVEYESDPEQPESEEQDFAILELEQPELAQLDRTVNLIPENRKNITYYSRPHVPSRPIPRPSLIAQRVEPDTNLQPATEPTSIPVPKPDPTIQPSIREPPPRNIFKPIPKPAVVKPLPYPRPTEIPTSPIINIKRPKFPVKPDKVKNPLQTQKPGRYWLTTDPSILQDYQCEQPNMYYSVESECDSYIECKLYVPMRYVCPDGLHFNPRVPFPDYPCGYPSDVKCEGRSIKLGPQSTAQCPRQYGYFLVEDSDCSRYIMCQEGYASVMNCPAGLVFNAEHSSCDWPENVPSCKPKVFQGFTCPDPQLEDDDRVSDILKYYRYGQSCIEYIACQRGYPRLLSCDRGLSFDEESQTCIESEYVTGCLVATPRLAQSQ